MTSIIKTSFSYAAFHRWYRMPPPNFARKKRKSRSRGSSAKRASRNRGETLSSTSKLDKRSSSVDVTSESSRELDETLKDGHNSKVIATHSEEPSLLSLAHDVASVSISTAETTMKNSPCKKNLAKTGKSAKLAQSIEGLGETIPSSNSFSQNLNSNTASHTQTMVQEEEKLNKLCKLLERIDSTYGKNSCPNSPSKTTPVKERVNVTAGDKSGRPTKEKQPIDKCPPSNNLSKKETPQHPPQQSIPNDKAKEKSSTEKGDAIPNDVAKEENLTQEEKQALRKAKKDAKKVAKQGGTKSAVSQEVAKTDEHSLSNHTPEVKAEPTQSSDVAIPKVKEVTVEKSKAELKRERREKQEAQRAAKEAAKAQASVAKSEVVSKPKIEPKKEETTVKKTTVKRKDVTLLSERHLPLLEHLSTPKTDQYRGSINSTMVHPAVRAAGLSMKEMIVDGCISRVLATLSAICSLIEDYQTPPSCDLSRDLSSQLLPNIAFLNSCRPLSEPMNNAIRFVKREINKVESSVPEIQAKEDLVESIETYIHQNILLASEAIIENSLEFIEDQDVILTFGFSSLVYEVLKAAVSSEREKLSLVMVDNPGAPSGINLLQSFVELGVKVYYRILPDLPHIINKVTKVVVEAEAVVLNGAVIGPCGTAGLILMASSRAVPVIVLSHTFKFCNIDLTDSLVVNELGDASGIVDCPSASFSGLLAEWKDSPSLNVVNLVYDVTPSHLINILVTERNNFPTSVVPVIIKRNYADILGHD